jgi:hypothetical protein
MEHEPDEESALVRRMRLPKLFSAQHYRLARKQNDAVEK